MAIGGDPVTPGGEAQSDESEWTVVQLRAEGTDDAAAEPAEEEPSENGAGARATRGTTKPAKTGSSMGDYLRSNGRAAAAFVLLALGVVIVLLGWYGAANTNILTEQIPYLISGGLLGIALIIVAGYFASSATLERQNRELREDLKNAIGALGSSRHAFSPGAVTGQVADGQVFVVDGGRSYHFAGCPIVEGKESSELALTEAEGSGYGACKLCGRD